MQSLLRERLQTKRRVTVPQHKQLCDFYHANRTPEERERVQRAWMTGETLILAATVAFGMGIDKADVRWVFHHSLPKSLEGALLCSRWIVPRSDCVSQQPTCTDRPPRSAPAPAGGELT